MRPFPPQYAAPGQVHPRQFPPGNVSPYYGTTLRPAWQQPNLRRPNRGPQLPVVLVCLLLPALLIIGVGTIVNSSSRDTSSAPYTTSEPRSTPGRTTAPERTAAPGTRPSSQPTVSFPQVEVPSLPSWLPSRDWEDLPTSSNKAPAGLVDHPIYKANYPVGNCPAPPKGFRNRESHTAYYESMIACLQEVWRPYLTALGIEQKPVDLVAYDSNVNTPCGSDNQDLTAFYCPSSTTIYVSRKKYEFDAKAGPYAAMTAIHEHFHHLQNQLGILGMSRKFDADAMEVSRRIELQDICSTSRLQLTLNLGIGADDYKSFLKTPLGDQEHGARETIIRWIDRGFYMTTLQGCNTWGVSPRRTWPDRDPVTPLPPRSTERELAKDLGKHRRAGRSVFFVAMSVNLVHYLICGSSERGW